MTFQESDLNVLVNTDFSVDDDFIDDECFDNCYIYTLCPICYGANYFNCGTFKVRDKGRCKIQKLIALFFADLQAKRILKNPDVYSDNVLHYTIEAIKKIRSLYLQEFESYLN